MDNPVFTDAFLELAYRAVMFSMAETDEQKKLITLISEVCAKHKLNFKNFMDAFNEITSRLGGITDATST